MGLTVQQLIDMLLAEDPTRIVVCQRDAEGNGYSPLSGIGTGMYRADSTWSGERGMEAEALDEDARKAGYSEDDVFTDGERALFLHPVN